MPEYGAMIRREDDGPDPLIPEPLGAPKGKKPGKHAKPPKKAGKRAKPAKKGK